jgi:hypothetical protein
MPPKLSTNPLDWVVSALDTILGCIFLLSFGIGLGMFSLSFYRDIWDLIAMIFGWPIELIRSVGELWGLLIVPVLAVVFWGMLYDVWNKATLFAWAMVIGALMTVSLRHVEIGWPALLLALPAYIFYFSYGPAVQRWIWKRRMNGDW